MPTEFTLELYAEKEFPLPRFTGYISRGLLLNIVREVNPAVSQDLHEANRPKPYSVTPIYFRSKAKSQEGFIVDPMHPCRVKFRFLRDEHARLITEYFLKKSTLTVFDTTLQIASLAVRCQEYRQIEEESKPQASFQLLFKTPTYLATLGSSYHYLFPEPNRIFLNLLRLWNEYSTGRRYGKEEFIGYRKWLTRELGVSEHRLATRLAHMGKKKATGFVGWVTYESRTSNQWDKLTATLARFAEYSNIGGNRTGGFGATRATNRMMLTLSRSTHPP